jgi:hypothetical protein
VFNIVGGDDLTLQEVMICVLFFAAVACVCCWRCCVVCCYYGMCCGGEGILGSRKRIVCILWCGYEGRNVDSETTCE